MNRAITGAWAPARARSNLNLNAAAPAGSSSSSAPPQPPPPVGSAAAAALAAAAAVAAQQGDAADGPSTREASPMPDEGAATPGKRKLRTSAAGGSSAAGASGSGSSSSKRSRAAAAASASAAERHAPPSTRLRDLGGVGGAIEKVLELIAMPLCHPEIYAHTGVKPPRGVLLHGPPGCGKTMLAGAIAGDLSIPFLSVSAPSIVSGTSGESEATLRQLFDDAAKLAPCILFIDEIDAITPKRETAQREMERRIVAQLLTCLDDLSWDKTAGKPVMVIGATNRPDSLDPALRRAGRFDHEIALGVPDEAGREQILRVLSASLRLEGNFDFRALAKATPGYVGADLVALTAAAGILAVKRIFSDMGNGGPWQLEATPSAPAQSQGDVEMAEQQQSDASAAPAAAASDAPAAKPAPVPTPAAPSAVARATASFFEAMPAALANSSIATFLRTHPGALSASELEPLSITGADFAAALPSVQPSSQREGFATVPDVTWADVGALHETRDELCMAIVEPIRRPELFRAVGVSASSGVLLWGPPGCGKTLLAKAVANESGANFISVKGPELLNKYVGESERAVRQVFARARTSSPCVIFFDELDALVPRRDDALSESSSRVVNTLLTELDGLEARVQTYVIGATNRPDMIDPAMCRPGRLDKLLYVDLPRADERLEILRTLTTRTPLAAGVDLAAVALDSRADGYSGADLAALTREAAVLALREALRRAPAAAPSAGIAAAADHGSSAADGVEVSQAHFAAALAKVAPSVSGTQRARYAALRTRLAGTPAGAGAGARAAKRAAADNDGAERPRRFGGDGNGEAGGEAPALA